MPEEEVSTEDQRRGFNLAIFWTFVGGGMTVMAVHPDFSAWWWVGPPVTVLAAVWIGWKAQIGREVDTDRP